jgi:Zn-dependent metalloprotease
MNRFPLLLTLLAACNPSGTLFSEETPESLEQAESLAAEHLDMLAVKSGADELRITRVSIDALGMAHARAQQYIDGVPVFGGEAIAHLDTYGELVLMTDDLVYNVSASTTPQRTAELAIDDALKVWKVGQGSLDADPTADLWLIRHDGDDHLAWRVRFEHVSNHSIELPVIFIDAQTGEELLSYDNLQTASGTGEGYYTGGTVSFEVSTSGGSYILDDLVNNIHTKDAQNRTRSFNQNAEITSTSSSFGTTDRAGVDAHYGASQVVDYYSTVHGRSSFNDAGAEVRSRVHYSRNYVNAFWDGSQLTYGDGDGSNSDALTSMDIVAHEFTHAVTDYSANLIYSGESGALNESMSDVFAAAIEAHVDGGTSANTWDIGEDCWTPRTSGDALRYMDNPTADGSSYDYYPTRYTGSSDNGGVHWNSGIGNLAFYLASEGGSHPRGVTTNTVTGVGIEVAAEIWYRALTVYMTSSTDFAGARTATLQAATDLYGATSSAYDAVDGAWTAVGVTDGGGGGGGGGDTGSGGGLDCTGGTLYSSTLSGSGSAYEISLSSAAAGTHSAVLSGPSSADFDLYLYKLKRNGSWSTAASSTTSTSEESASYTTTRTEDLLWRVYSYSGSGSFEICVTTP